MTSTTHPTMMRIFEITKLSPSELALAINEFPQTITNWSKRGVSKSGALKIAEKFNINPTWILSGEGNARNAQHANISIVNTAMLFAPIINWVQAGNFQGIGDNSYDEYAPVHGYSSADSLYWLRITGDSMAPEFQHGDLILVDSDKIPVGGNYVIAKQSENDETTFKKLKLCGFDENGREYAQLIPLNTYYPPIDSRYIPFDIVGVVIEHKRKTI